MVIETKPAKGDLGQRIASLEAELAEAEAVAAKADAAHIDVVGRVILEEADMRAVGTSSKALEDAQTKAIALKSALSLMREREKAREAQEASDRVQTLREQSEQAHKATQAALSRLATLSRETADAISDVDSESVVLNSIHSQLVEAEPALAAQIAQDRQQAETRTAEQHRQAVAQTRSTAAGARQSLSRLQPSAVLGVAISLDAETLVPVASSVDDASRIIGAWEMASVEQADHGLETSLRDIYEQYAADVHDAGLGWLPTPDRTIREVSAEMGSVAVRLIPSDLRAGIARLDEFLPSTSAEGVSVRTIHKDVFEARRQASRFEAARAALRELVGN